MERRRLYIVNGGRRVHEKCRKNKYPRKAQKKTGKNESKKREQKMRTRNEKNDGKI
jgi:hypothetical protein